MTDFDEPLWGAPNSINIYNRKGLQIAAVGRNTALRDRVIECVNALTGIEDLAAFMAIVRDIAAYETDEEMMPDDLDYPIHKLVAMLPQEAKAEGQTN